MTTSVAQFFKWDHLPPHLQEISKPIGELAAQMENTLSDGPEKSAGMRKLLEAKDCFVRAQIEMKQKAERESVEPKGPVG